MFKIPSYKSFIELSNKYVLEWVKLLSIIMNFNQKNVKKENWTDLIINTNRNEEFNKSKFLNKSIGLENCLITTILYNHKSSICLQCNFSLECKEKLKILYPKIHKIRGY